MKEKVGIRILLISSFTLVFFAIMKNNEGNHVSTEGNNKSAEQESYEKGDAESELATKIGLAIGEKGYRLGGIKQDTLSNKNVKLNFLFGDDVIDNDDSKQEVREIAKKIINENNYDFDSFQLHFSRMRIAND